MYDVVISLKPSFCVKAYQSIDVCEGTFLPHYRNYDPLQKEKILPVIDFDPVKHYVDELRNMYGELAMFFYDTFGGSKIYVLWKPDSLKGKDLNDFFDKSTNLSYKFINLPLTVYKKMSSPRTETESTSGRFSCLWQSLRSRGGFEALASCRGASKV